MSLESVIHELHEHAFKAEAETLQNSYIDLVMLHNKRQKNNIRDHNNMLL